MIGLCEFLYYCKSITYYCYAYKANSNRRYNLTRNMPTYYDIYLNCIN